MPLSEAKKQAYAQLDEAVENLRRAYEYDDDILTGWVLLTSSVRVPTEDEIDEDDDELDLTSQSGWYTKRGQDPTLSYGIVCEAYRHYDRVQKEYGDG